MNPLKPSIDTLDVLFVSCIAGKAWLSQIPLFAPYGATMMLFFNIYKLSRSQKLVHVAPTTADMTGLSGRHGRAATFSLLVLGQLSS